MARDMSNWPQVLLDALAPGIAPTLDELAEKTRKVFWSEELFVAGKETDTGREHLQVQTLRDAAIRVLEGTPPDTIHRALVELWTLNEYAMPFPTSYDAIFDGWLLGAAPPRDILYDVVHAAICTRCRLDEATEAEDIERRRMEQLTFRGPSSPEVEAVANALAGRSGDVVEPMTFDELVAWLQRPDLSDEDEPS
jgi:hypothetical protein